MRELYEKSRKIFTAVNVSVFVLFVILIFALVGISVSYLWLIGGVGEVINPVLATFKVIATGSELVIEPDPAQGLSGFFDLSLTLVITLALWFLASMILGVSVMRVVTYFTYARFYRLIFSLGIAGAIPNLMPFVLPEILGGYSGKIALVIGALCGIVATEGRIFKWATPTAGPFPPMIDHYLMEVLLDLPEKSVIWLRFRESDAIKGATAMRFFVERSLHGWDALIALSLLDEMKLQDADTVRSKLTDHPDANAWRTIRFEKIRPAGQFHNVRYFLSKVYPYVEELTFTRPGEELIDYTVEYGKQYFAEKHPDQAARAEQDREDYRKTFGEEPPFPGQG